MTDFKSLAERALNEGGQDQILAALRGIGYGLLAVQEKLAAEATLLSEPLTLQPLTLQPKLESYAESEAAVGKDTVRRAEALAQGILERQIVFGEATVGWDDRGQSQGRRIEMARMILDAGALGRTTLTEPLMGEFGLSHEDARRVLGHADAVLDMLDHLGAGEEDAKAERHEEARNLLLACGWEPGPIQEDDEVFWIFGDYGPMTMREAVQLISSEGRGITVLGNGSEGVEELRAKADAVLYGQGFVCGGRRLPPERVRVFTSAPMRGILQS